MTDNNENSFLKRLFGKKDDAAPKAKAESTPEGVPPEMPDAIKALFSMLAAEGIGPNSDLKPADDGEMPPEVRALVEGLRAQGMNVAAINVGGECECPPGHPQCGKTNVESLTEWLKNFSVRVIHDPEDTGEEKMDYFAEEDVRLALFASARMGELLALQSGVNVREVAFARLVAGSVIGNAGEILNSEDLRVDLSNTEVPDTIPTDWKMDD